MVRRSLFAAAVAGVLLSACGDDGRTLAPAPEVPIAPETTTTVAAAPDAGFTTGGESGSSLVISSPSFEPGGFLDETFTCDGLNVPPSLVITGVPPTAAELSVVVIDLDADNFVHWVVSGLPPVATTIESGVVPPGAVTARTDSGVVGWDGPCPPPGDDPHRYSFSVYATGEPVGLTPGLDGREAISLIETAAIASNRVVAFYASVE